MLTPEQIEQALQTITDRQDKLDALVSGKVVLGFRCRHSGLIYPTDYASEWGRKYGLALGKDVVSECLDSLYHEKPVLPSQARMPEDVMYPVGVTKAQVDPVFIASPEYVQEKKPVIDMEDKHMSQRIVIIRQKQLQNPKSKLLIMQGALS